jgi:hypothetical protein
MSPVSIVASSARCGITRPLLRDGRCWHVVVPGLE